MLQASGAGRLMLSSCSGVGSIIIIIIVIRRVASGRWMMNGGGGGGWGRGKGDGRWSQLCFGSSPLNQHAKYLMIPPDSYPHLLISPSTHLLIFAARTTRSHSSRLPSHPLVVLPVSSRVTVSRPPLSNSPPAPIIPPLAILSLLQIRSSDGVAGKYETLRPSPAPQQGLADRRRRGLVGLCKDSFPPPERQQGSKARWQRSADAHR